MKATRVGENLGLILPLIGKILWLFLASLAPLIFLVGLIAGLDRWGAQNRFLRNLETYGKQAEAHVTYLDDEDQYAGLTLFDSNGQERFGRLDFRYYPAEVVKSIRPGDTLQVLYIDALISEGERTALLEYYPAVQRAPAISADVWWVLGISWLVIAIYPQFVFLGMVDFDALIVLTGPTKRG